MDLEKVQNIRRQILEVLYNYRADFIVMIPILAAELAQYSEKELHAEIKYLEGKAYVEILGSFCGKDYLHFEGARITSHGIDIYENNADAFIWPSIAITNNNITANSSNVAINSKKVKQKSDVKK